jgi:hypothetical protein
LLISSTGRGIIGESVLLGRAIIISESVLLWRGLLVNQFYREKGYWDLVLLKRGVTNNQF